MEISDMDANRSFYTKLRKCSTFSRRDILKILSDIITVIQGSAYNSIYYTEINHSPVSVIYCSDDYDIDTGFNSSLEELENSGKALFLVVSSCFIFDIICFNSRNNVVSPLGFFANFSYLIEFINSVINYRLENNLTEGITLEKLEELKNKFLAEKLGEERESVSDRDVASKKLVTQEGK